MFGRIEDIGMNFIGLDIKRRITMNKLGWFLVVIIVSFLSINSTRGETTSGEEWDTLPYRVKIEVDTGLFERQDYVVRIPIEKFNQLLRDEGVKGEIEPNSIRVVEPQSNKRVPSLIKGAEVRFLMKGLTQPLQTKEYLVYFDILGKKKRFPLEVSAEEMEILKQPLPGENLLPNSSFEKGSLNKPELPEGWDIILDKKDDIQASMKRTDEESHTGNYSLRWEVRGNNRGGWGVVAHVKGGYIPLKPNTTYIISFWCKVLDVEKDRFGPYLWLEFKNAEKQQADPTDFHKSRVGTGAGQGVIHTEWRQYVAKQTSPPQTKYGLIQLGSWGGVGLAFIDDVEIREENVIVPCEIKIGKLEILEVKP